MNEPHRQTASAIAGQVRRGAVSAAAICRGALDHVGRIGAASGFTRVLHQRAMLRAEAVDKIVQAGLDPGPLAGVPFGVADMFDVALQPTTAGSEVRLRSRMARQDARAIALMEAAGAVLIGTQNMDEFGYGFVAVNAFFGTTPNPHDPARTAGGAAGGSAAAVATGTVPVSLAFDTNGSLRIPAALCGVLGLKPTYGALSREGTFPFVDSMDVIGPLARDLDDLALVYAVLRQTAAAPTGSPGALRFGRLKGWFDRNIAAEFGPVLDDCWTALGRIQYDLEHAELARAAASLVIAAEGANIHRTRLEQDMMTFEPATRDRLLAGLLVPSESYVQAQRFRSFIRERSALQFRTCDVLFTPAAPGHAPRLDDLTMDFDGQRVPARSHLGIYTQPISLIGLPALVLPLKRTGAMPLGIQLIAPPNREDILIRAARDLGALDLAWLSVSSTPSGEGQPSDL